MSNISVVDMAVLNGAKAPEVTDIKRISPSVMKVLLGGEFPDTGFAWEYVYYFQLEDDGVWEPYDTYHEILPAVGFTITAQVAI